jgi:hypothetical protein
MENNFFHLYKKEGDDGNNSCYCIYSSSLMLCSIQQISCHLKGYYIWHFAFGAFSSRLAFACGQRLPVEVEDSGPAGAALHEP